MGGPSCVFLNLKYSNTRDLTLPGYGYSFSSAASETRSAMLFDLDCSTAHVSDLKIQ